MKENDSSVKVQRCAYTLYSHLQRPSSVPKENCAMILHWALIARQKYVISLAVPLTDDAILKDGYSSDGDGKNI